MATNEFRIDVSQTLVPAQPDPLNRTETWKPGNNLSVLRGQAMARKTSDGKAYPLNLAATDGTQIFAGFSHVSFNTDASGNVYLTCNGSTGATFLSPPMTAIDVFVAGVFDPNDLFTGAPTGASTAEVDTVTIGGTIVVGDTYTIATNASSGVPAAVTFTATNTSANTVALELANAWASNPLTAPLATVTVSSNVSTFTAVKAGYPLSLSVGKNSSAGTITLAQTTAPVSPQVGEVDTFTLTTNPSTGDVFTATVTYPNLTTATATFTVAATQTVAAAVAGLQAAWNTSNPVNTYATATNTSSAVVLTSLNPGQVMNVAVTTTSATTTISKTVTTPAFGRNLSDILPGAPGARIIQPTGYWRIP